MCTAFVAPRYLELVHPLWHKVRRRTCWMRGSVAFCWCFGLGVNALYMVPTTEVPVRSKNIAFQHN